MNPSTLFLYNTNGVISQVSATEEPFLNEIILQFNVQSPKDISDHNHKIKSWIDGLPEDKNLISHCGGDDVEIIDLLLSLGFIEKGRYINLVNKTPSVPLGQVVRENFVISKLLSEYDLGAWHSLIYRIFKDSETKSIEFNTWKCLMGAQESNIDFDSVYGAVFNGELVGILVMSNYNQEDNSRHVLQIGVLDSHRRLGIADSLLGVAARLAHKDGAKLTVNVEQENKYGALELYKKHGFVEKSIWMRYIKYH